METIRQVAKRADLQPGRGKMPGAEEETLEGRIARLYAEGHYTDAEMKQFLGIPKGHRVDPFEVADDGDVYWADRRNVEGAIADVRQAKRDRAEGRSISFGSVGELDAYIRSL